MKIFISYVTKFISFVNKFILLMTTKIQKILRELKEKSAKKIIYGFFPIKDMQTPPPAKKWSDFYERCGMY